MKVNIRQDPICVTIRTCDYPATSLVTHSLVARHRNERITVLQDASLSRRQNHAKIAGMLAQKLEFEGDWVMGEEGHDFVFLRLPKAK